MKSGDTALKAPPFRQAYSIMHSCVVLLAMINVHTNFEVHSFTVATTRRGPEIYEEAQLSQRNRATLWPTCCKQRDRKGARSAW